MPTANPPSQLSQSDRRALRSVVAQFFMNGAISASFVARFPEIRDRIGVSIGVWGLLLTTAGVFGITASLVAGRLVERIGTRRIMMLGSVGTVGTLLLIGAATTPVVFVLGLLVFGISDVNIDIAMNLQGSWISARKRVPVMNRLHGTWSLGALVGGLGASRAAAAGLSLPAHFVIVVVLSTVILAWSTRSLLPTDEHGHADAPLPGAAPAPRSTRFGPLTMLVGAGMAAIVLEMAGMEWATFRLSDDFFTSDATASLGFVAFMAGMTVSRVSGDFVQHRFGRAVLHWASVVLASVGIVVATLVPHELLVLAGFLVLGSGVAIFMPKLYDDAA
ncbi:MAG: MFS transporter [Ilumatobacteraceae bacterium]